MSKIPEGATHKNAYGFFRKLQDGIWYSYADGDWIRFIDAEPETYIPIKAEPEWTGEGLPPVGIECEVLWDSLTPSYQTCKIIGHDEGRAVFRYTSGPEKGGYGSDTVGTIGRLISKTFRPIRTPDQIAAEKRDAAIKEMQRLVGSCNTFPFADLYDYGYRLQVEK